MKKNRRIFLGSIIAITAFWSCSPPAKKNGTDSSMAATTVKLPKPTDSVTLTGMPWKDAKQLIANFRDDSTCDGKQTSIWLDSTWVTNTCKLLDSEKCDGIRIYFAKENKTKALTIVLVSTKDIGADAQAESKEDHKDYFNHANLASTTLQNQPGALMFANQCPCNASDPNWKQNKPIRCKPAWVAINNFCDSGKINIHSEWFEKEVFTDLIKTHSGIRIYFARHTNSTAAAPSHINKSAFILFPTKKYTDNSGQVTQRDDLSYTFKSQKKKAKPQQDPPGDGSAADNGEQCPPNCNGTSS